MTTCESASIEIKHLVLSGGTVWGFHMIGILVEAIETGFLNMENIHSIYGTSIGALVGTAMSLKIDAPLLRDYFVKRPWDTLCKNNRYSVLELYDGRGILHQGFIEDLFDPLLKSVDLSCATTLAELYEYNGIDLHIYTTELNQYELVDISFKTHPEWRVVDAVYASCSIPLLFSPLIRDGKCYIDGGFFLNYPIDRCPAENPEEVFGISLGNLPENPVETPITQASTLADVVFTSMMKSIQRSDMFSNNNTLSFPYQIVLYNRTTLEYFMEVLYQQTERERLVTEGKGIFHASSRVEEPSPPYAPSGL
jgi:predicted acylesterase/phospholipase RssA